MAGADSDVHSETAAGSGGGGGAESEIRKIDDLMEVRRQVGGLDEASGRLMVKAGMRSGPTAGATPNAAGPGVTSAQGRASRKQGEKKKSFSFFSLGGKLANRLKGSALINYRQRWNSPRESCARLFTLMVCRAATVFPL